MVDSEMLISCIEKYPSIWNTAFEGYHNKKLKESAWDSVCEEVLSEWSTLTQNMKADNQMNLKKKWHNIRDYYKKELCNPRTVETGESAKKRKKYVYGNILGFLKPVFQHRETSGDFDVVPSPQQNTNTSDGKSTEERVTSPTSTKSEVKTSSAKKKNAGKLNSFEKTIIATLDKRTSQDEDPDFLFLKSLLPDMKKLSDGQKIDYKLGIIQLYKDIINAAPPIPIENKTYSTQCLNPYPTQTNYIIEGGTNMATPKYYKISAQNVSSSSSDSASSAGEYKFSDLILLNENNSN